MKGHRMHLGAWGYYLSPELLADSYEPGTTRLFEGLVKEGMAVVDVGANIGYYTLLAARLVGSSGRVYAFEPEPRNYALLVDNVKLNGYTNVVAVQQAVSNSTGPVVLRLSSDSAMHSLIQNRDVGGQEVAVEATTLDDFLEREG